MRGRVWLLAAVVGACVSRPVTPRTAVPTAADLPDDVQALVRLALTLDAAVARAVRETGLPIDDVLPMASTIPAARVGASTAGRVVAEWDAGTGSLTVGHVNGA